MKKIFGFYSVFFVYFLFSCTAKPQKVTTGAERINEYINMLSGKNVAIAGNHTSLAGSVHLVDTLLSLGVNIVKIFSPEHGFRGISGAGDIVQDSTDESTGIPVISLYGLKKKPAKSDMEGIDIVIYDIQDVGVRFYTYISTLHYIMESCAGSGIPLLIPDRPNPNANYIDGPVLEMGFQSFIGMHPVPVVYGMTTAEYAQMINGEGWLKDGNTCELHIITCENYSHESDYILPVPPSPNLKNQHAVRLYPSIALFEGTVISEGRGTDYPFEVYGHPELSAGDYYFTPCSRAEAKNPKLMGKLCRGEDLRGWSPDGDKWEKIELGWLINAYNNFPDKDLFFNDFFLRLCGTSQILDDIRAGKSETEIREKWQDDLLKFRSIREKYLLYP